MVELDWFESGADLAHALAHPVRLSILDLLRDEGAYVMHLTTMLRRPQANISQHLAILRDAGLVVDEREGMTVVYRVRDPHVFVLVDRMKALAIRSTRRCDCGDERVKCARRAGRSQLCHCPHCARK
jgi:DNA-binding transcriptional ArsR family regulator